MKQAQSETTRYAFSDRAWSGGGIARVGGSRIANGSLHTQAQALERRTSWVEICLSVMGMIFYLIMLPFRLVFLTMAWVGRLAAIVLGFCLMVVGIALWAGPLFFLGIPLFLVGLVLTLKSLG
jgi:hypothetical protein